MSEINPEIEPEFTPEAATPIVEATHVKSDDDWLSRPLARFATLDWYTITYIGIILAAIITRFFDVGTRVVSHDESLHTQYSYQFYNGDGFSHTPLMHGPFLFHITAASYWLFGHNDFTARVPVALFGVLLVAIPYFLRDWIGKKGALFASFVFLISPYVTYYSRYIRHDVYVIVFALICFISTIYYLRERRDKYLWWFAAGLAMMYCTKEVSFIYTAIFGSFLGIRLAARMIPTRRFRDSISTLVIPLAIIVIGVGLIGGSRFFEGGGSHGESAIMEDGEPAAEGHNDEITRNIPAVAGWIILGCGLFFFVIKLRDQLDEYPEFDLIMLYATLLLPSLSAYLVRKAGIDPLIYNFPDCSVTTDTAVGPLREMLLKLVNGDCWSGWLNAPPMTTTLFVIFLFGASVVVGIWWSARRWLIALVIFQVLFLFFYTSVFTNPTGWASGTVGSLGYWLAQQGVERGSQPWYYYLFATPFYEFMPVIFSWLAMREWLHKRHLGHIGGFIITTLLLAVIGFSFTNWLFTRSTPGAGLSLPMAFLLAVIVINWAVFKIWRQRNNANGWTGAVETALSIAALLAVMVGLAQLNVSAMANGVARESTSMGVIVALAVLAAGVAYWFFIRRETVRKLEPDITWAKRLDVNALTDFVPYCIWWLFLTWIAYSWAGEKMPWLSIHMVIPMAFLIGWYFNEKLKDVSWREFTANKGPLLLGLSVLVTTVGFIMLKTLMVDVRGTADQTAGNLTNLGSLIGRVATLAGLFALFAYMVKNVSTAVIRRTWLLASFIVLSALTIRFTYLSSFINHDSTREFIGYAHGGQATKAQVMRQIEEISMRMHGDKSINVIFDDDSSWPMHWYLRDYPNNRFVGGNPGSDITDAPVLVIGNDNWTEVDAIVRNDYEYETYTYLAWPMEEYRKFGWDAAFGMGQENRGLGDADVREALWDIFFHRDYDKYGEVFGGTYREGEWPLRDELRLYIRRDVLAKLWDSGVIGTAYQPKVELYDKGELEISAVQIFGGSNGSGNGQLTFPRNVAVGEDGRVYVADSGNHRIQVFDASGNFVTAFGSFADGGNSAPTGAFNEPWGLAVDDEFVYVADTWNHRLQKFTLDGDFVAQFGNGGGPSDDDEGALLFFGPRDIALDGDGNLLVTDTGNSRVQIISRDGEYIKSIGTNGFELGQFSEPTGLTVAADGSLFVAEAWARRVQRWVNQDFAVATIEVDSWDGTSLNNKPYIAVDHEDRLILSDPEGYRMLIYNLEGDYLGRFGYFGTDDQSFDLPTGLATDADGNIYVADTNNHRIMKFPPLDVDTPITLDE